MSLYLAHFLGCDRSKLNYKVQGLELLWYTNVGEIGRGWGLLSGALWIMPSVLFCSHLAGGTGLLLRKLFCP